MFKHQNLDLLELINFKIILLEYKFFWQEKINVKKFLVKQNHNFINYNKTINKNFQNLLKQNYIMNLKLNVEQKKIIIKENQE